MNNLEHSFENNNLIVKIKESKLMDDAAIVVLAEKIIALLESVTGNECTIDFSEVQYISSSMLGKIVAINKKSKEKNVKVILKSVNPDIKEIFQITKLEKFFTFID